MTATTLGIAVLVTYLVGITCQGLGLGIGRHMLSDNQNRPTEVGVYHPVSIWIANRVDPNGDKSQKPRA